jgi:hypothetical protein
MSLNVFGRTLGPGNNTAGNANGRQHNPNHQVSIAIGKPFKGGVIGGCVNLGGTKDYGCTNINSADGSSASGTGGDIQAGDTLASFGKTMLAAVGADPTFIGSAIPSGSIITGALV